MPISFRVVTQWTIFLAWNIPQSHEASEGEWLDVFKHVARVVEEVASKHQTNDSPAANRILSCLISWREGYGRRCGRLEKDLDARSPVVTCLQRERLLCVQGQGDVSMSRKLGTPANPDIIVFHTPLWIHYSKSRYTYNMHRLEGCPCDETFCTKHGLKLQVNSRLLFSLGGARSFFIELL